VSPLDLAWFAASFPGARLTVVNPARFETDQVRGLPLRDWLVEDGHGLHPAVQVFDDCE